MKKRALLLRYHRPLMLLAALYLCGAALWRMVQTSRYVYEAQVVPGVVDDWRKVPVDSLLELWCAGNFSLSADTCYQPVVRFTLPSGAIMSRLMPDMDSAPYELGQQVEVLTLPQDPGRARLYQVRHLWGGDALVFALGLGALAYSAAGWRKRRRPTATLPPTAPAPSASKGKATNPRRKKAQAATPASSRRSKAQEAPSPAPRRNQGKRKKKSSESAP